MFSLLFRIVILIRANRLRNKYHYYRVYLQIITWGETMPIEQMKIGYDNFCYVIYCLEHKKAAIVDPGFDSTPARNFLTSKNLVFEYIILTHHHSDHTAEAKHLKKTFPASKVVASEEDGKKLPVQPDIVIRDNDHLKLGTILCLFF